MGRAICTTDSARRRPLALEPIASASTNYRAEYARIADSHALERRRGTLTAMAIEDAIQRKGWPIGAVFGPEPALAESFGVGVRVARQAFRLLEARGACRLQRGRGGGLIIRKPEIGSTALVMAHHLIWSGATMDEVWDARMILEPMAFAAAATSGEGLCDTDLDQMDASAALANQIANPCLALAFMCLEQFPGASACASWAVRADLKAAIAQGAADRAAQLAAEAVALRRLQDDGCLGVQFGLAVSAHAQLQSRRNLASALALRIGADISYQGCREGRRLGSLAELGERYNIGLPVLIEAIRILEDVGLWNA